MASALSRLMAKLGLDTSEFERGLSGAERRAKQAGGSFTAAFSQATGLGRAFVTGLAGGVVTAAFAAITSNIHETVRSVAELGDEAKRSGLGLQAFQEWRYVADQNRVSIDALVDGFKELNLRADEWIVTGGGSASEAFQRLGFSADDLKRRLKDPSALMLEIVARLKGLDQAAQIRISDELFGGTGGEQFVQLLERGDEGLRQIIARSHEVGAVLDAEMIQKAQDLDRRWTELTSRVANFAKTVAVGLADIPWDIVETRIDELFSDQRVGRSILGDEIYEALAKLRALTDDQVGSVEALTSRYGALQDAAQAMAMELAGAASTADQMGNDALWEVLATASSDMRALADQFANGSITGEEFAAKMEEIRSKAASALNELQGIDRQQFGRIIGSLGGLGNKLLDLIGKAKELKANLPGAATALTDDRGEAIRDSRAGSYENSSPLAPTSTIRPKSAPQNVDFDWTGKSDKSGGTSKASNRKTSADMIAEIEQETAALRAEADAFLRAAGAGEIYGDQAEYAAIKAKLFTAMQQEGIKVTPALADQIERVAQAYGHAAQGADDARDKLDEMQRAAEAGEDALKTMTDSIIDGADSARDAFAGLLREIAKAQLYKGALGLVGLVPGGSGALSTLGSWLSFDGGGYTGSGVRSGGVDGKGGFPALLHPNETVLDHTRGQGAGAMSVTIGFDDSAGGFTAYVRDQAGQVVASASPAIVSQSVQATSRASRKSKSVLGL